MRAGCADTGLGDAPRWQLPRIGTSPRDACFALDSASVRDFSRVRRVQRLGLGPRSLPVVLANDPARVTGEGASMRPAVVAYRLLQLNTNYDVRAKLTSLDPRSTTRAATLFVFCDRGDSLRVF